MTKLNWVITSIIILILSICAGLSYYESFEKLEYVISNPEGIYGTFSYETRHGLIIIKVPYPDKSDNGKQKEIIIPILFRRPFKAQISGMLTSHKTKMVIRYQKMKVKNHTTGFLGTGILEYSFMGNLPYFKVE